MEQTEKRMAGTYEIIHAMYIGDREIVIGEWNEAPDGERFMCAVCTQNEIFAQYNQVMVSDDFAEIVKLYGMRMTKQAEKTIIDLNYAGLTKEDRRIYTDKDCDPVGQQDLNGKVVVIRPDVLRREYQQASHQICICTGGFGANPNARGRAVYCRNLLTGREEKFYRSDLMGILPPEKQPEWVQKGVEQYHKRKMQNKEAR